MSDQKACVACGRSFPRTEQYFHKSKDGLHSRCKQCRNKDGKRVRQRKASAKLDKIERGAVKLFTEAATIGGAHIPHSSELVEIFMEYFGGARGFGAAFMKQFYDAPPGGAFRTKMLDSVVRLVKDNTVIGGAKKPLELMSEDELIAELNTRVLQAAMNIANERTINGAVLPNVPVVEGIVGRQLARSVPAIPSGNGPDDGVPDAAVDSTGGVLRGVEGT